MANLLHNQQQGTNKTNAHVIVVDIEDFSDEEKQYISEKLVEICKGASSSYPASVVAQKLLEQFKKASDKNKNGLSAEFLQAIILRNQGFSQKVNRPLFKQHIKTSTRQLLIGVIEE